MNGDVTHIATTLRRCWNISHTEKHNLAGKVSLEKLGLHRAMSHIPIGIVHIACIFACQCLETGGQCALMIDALKNGRFIS